MKKVLFLASVIAMVTLASCCGNCGDKSKSCSDSTKVECAEKSAKGCCKSDSTSCAKKEGKGCCKKEEGKGCSKKEGKGCCKDKKEAAK